MQANDWILSENGDWKAIEDVYDTGEWELVYNLRVADFHTYFVGDESWGWAAWAHNTYLYRGDGAHVPGSGPIGSAINTALILAERAQISFDHVKQTNIGHADSIYKSWTTSFKAAVRFAGNPNRVTKVAEENVASLVLAGVIVVNNSTATRDLIKDHGVNKIAKQASSIKQIMDNNEEVLIEGVVPADVQVSGK